MRSALYFSIVLGGLTLGGCVHAADSPYVVVPGPTLGPLGEPEAAQSGEIEAFTAPEELDGEDPLPVTRDGALLTALRNSTLLEVAAYGPEIAQTYVPESLAAFDPQLMASLSYGRRKEELGSIQEFTFGSGGEPGGGLQTQRVLGDSLQETLANLTELAQQSAAQSQFEPFLDTEESTGEVRLSQYFPTGTSVFLTGGMSRTETNFTSEEFLGHWTVGIDQALLEGRGRAVNLVALRQAMNQAVSSEFRFQEAVLDLVAQVETTYWDLALAKELVLIQGFGVLLAKEQEEYNQDLVDVGLAVDAIVLAAQAERATREADLYEALGQVRQATITLVRLMNPDGASRWRVKLEPVDPPDVVQVPLNPPRSEELALQYRPELHQDEIALANRALDVVRTENALLPDLNLSARYGRTSLGSSIEEGFERLDDPEFDQYQVGLEFNMPLYNRGDEARHRRARLSESQAAATIADTKLQLASEVRQAIVDVETQWERIQAAKNSVEARQEELRIERDRYEVGLLTNLELLEVQRLLVQAKVSLATAKVRYIQALTRLYAAEGTLLARRGIFQDEGAENEPALPQ